jgi:hypothetical protein
MAVDQRKRNAPESYGKRRNSMDRLSQRRETSAQLLAILKITNRTGPVITLIPLKPQPTLELVHQWHQICVIAE